MRPRKRCHIFSLAFVESLPLALFTTMLLPLVQLFYVSIVLYLLGTASLRQYTGVLARTRQWWFGLITELSTISADARIASICFRRSTSFNSHADVVLSRPHPLRRCWC